MRLPEVKKSQTIRRKSTFRRVVKVSRSVVRMSPSVVRMSYSVDFVSYSVDFVSPLAPSGETIARDITRYSSARYGKTAVFTSAICDQKVAFRVVKMAKKRFLSVRNCDLRRLREQTGNEKATASVAYCTNDQVGEAGLEPAHSCEWGILSPLRLPFRHSPE